MTSSERAQRVAELVKCTIEREPDEWPAFLDQECGSDAAMRAEIESLLAHHERDSRFIEEPALHLAAESLVHAGTRRVGQIVGDYEILSLIGSGGMGEVYLARDRQLQRKAALKLVRGGLDSDDVVRRFKREEFLLASLNHPNIAQLYGSGMTADGIPFFAMEFVEGTRIDEFCNENQLSLPARLELFRKVCGAIHYAHQHLVVHRDIKPSNILVTAEGEPKLLDFGIAKLVEVDAARTMTEMKALTPEYASPEQVKGEGVTTATDIYSLGVILFELLTGQRPYRLKTSRPDELSRAICEEEPTKPSTAIARGDGSSKIQTPNLKSLRGDLDNIILMAMRKEPARRYASVEQFAEDIRRHLENRPVIARKDSWRYRSGKFIQRNRIGVAAATLVLVTLVGGIVATRLQEKKALRAARIAAEQRDFAQKQAIKAARVVTFLQNVLGFSDPGWASSNPERKRDATIVEALVEAGRRAEVELATEPEALAAVHFTIGTTYRVQGRYPEAEPHLRAALDIRRRVLGSENPDTAQSMVALAQWYLASTRYSEAEPLLREAIPVFRAAHDAKWLAITLNDYGFLESAKGDYAAAEKLLREGLDISSGLTGTDRALRAIMYGLLGTARAQQGDMVEAITFLEKSVEEHRSLPGEPRLELASTLQYLGTVRFLQADYGRAESLLREAFELFRKILGENHQSSAWPLIWLAELYCARADYEKARSEIEHAMQIQRNVPAEQEDLIWARVIRAKIQMRTGAPEKAESDLRSAIEKLAQLLPPDHPLNASARGTLGECLALQTRYTEAEPLLLECHEVLKTRFGAGDPRTQNARMRLINFYEAWGKPDEAARYRTI